MEPESAHISIDSDPVVRIRPLSPEELASHDPNRDAEGWPWSSARAHLASADDDLATAAPLLGPVGDWRAFLSLSVDDDEVDILRRHQRTGRPLGDDAFVERLEASLGRTLRPRKPGPKPTKGPKEPRNQ